MAQAVYDATAVTRGVIITNDAHATLNHSSLEIVLGGHPLPNEGSIQGTEKILQLLHDCKENECVLVLISGGGSSLFCKTRVPLCDLQHTIDLLIRSGAIIQGSTPSGNIFHLSKGSTPITDEGDVILLDYL